MHQRGTEGQFPPQPNLSVEPPRAVNATVSKTGLLGSLHSLFNKQIRVHYYFILVELFFFRDEADTQLKRLINFCRRGLCHRENGVVRFTRGTSMDQLTITIKRRGTGGGGTWRVAWPHSSHTEREIVSSTRQSILAAARVECKTTLVRVGRQRFYRPSDTADCPFRALFKSRVHVF